MTQNAKIKPRQRPGEAKAGLTHVEFFLFYLVRIVSLAVIVLFIDKIKTLI